MCLGVPGRVVHLYRQHDLLMGKVDFGGVSREVCLEHLPEAALDDYVLVHVGFGLSIVDPEEAQRIFTLLESINDSDLPDSP